MSKIIPLTQGKFAIVDDEDFESLNQHKWFAMKAPRTMYAVRNVRLETGKKRLQYMHRVIMGAAPSEEVDHRDRDGLNCTRDNLRRATSSENKCNRIASSRNKTGVKGVFWDECRMKWVASVRKLGNVWQRRFSSFSEAVEARAKAAKSMHQEFVRL